MYCVKKSIAKTMPEDVLSKRQELYDEVLPDWERRIFRLAAETFPKVDQRLMGLDDIQQELRLALWEGVLAFDISKGVDIKTWIFKILNQASSLIAKLQYHRMPHGAQGHGIQLLGLKDETEEDQENARYVTQALDPFAIGQIEVGVEKAECIRVIRPVLNTAFEQSVFDLFMEGLTGGEIVRELGLDHNRGGDARVSSVRLKIKIVYALMHSIPIREVSAAKNAPYLAGRMKHLLSSRKETEEEPDQIPPPNMNPQFI